jgi:site-specific DNA recombinase
VLAGAAPSFKNAAASFKDKVPWRKSARLVHAMYVGKPDGRIGHSFHVQMSEQWQVEQDKLVREITRHQAADRSYLEEGARLIEIAHGARRLFVSQQAQERRTLLNLAFSNSTWRDGRLTPTFRQPFDLIAEATAVAMTESGGGGPDSPGHPVWLGN